MKVINSIINLESSSITYNIGGGIFCENSTIKFETSDLHNNLPFNLSGSHLGTNFSIHTIEIPQKYLILSSDSICMENSCNWFGLDNPCGLCLYRDNCSKCEGDNLCNFPSTTDDSNSTITEDSLESFESSNKNKGFQKFPRIFSEFC